MTRHYLRIAIRHLGRQWSYTLINLSGLAIALACALFIFAYVRHEWSYDNYHPAADRLYRVALSIKTGDQPTENFALTSGSLAGALAGLPEVERTARVLPTFDRNTVVKVAEGKSFSAGQLHYCDNELFDLLGLELTKVSDREALLTAPNTIVLDEQMASRYFGSSDPLGKTLQIGDKAFTVTGIMKPAPANTHFRPTHLLSLATYGDVEWIQNWMATIFYTYIRLKPGQAPGPFEEKIRHIANNYAKDEMDKFQQTLTYFLQPVGDIHLHSHLRYEHEANASAGYLYMFLLIAFLIIAIAGINYVNLATARSGDRAREIGVRKVFGGLRGQLRRQFLTEALLLALAAFFLALLMVSIARPVFGNLLGMPLFLDFFRDPVLLAVGAGMALGVGLLAGGYPAAVLAGLRPLEVLRGRFHGSRRGGMLRNVLVTGQFAVSMGLVVATLTIAAQVRYMQRYDLGFDKEQVLVISSTRSALGKNQYRPLKQELQRQPFVEAVSVSGVVPGHEPGNNLITVKGQEHRKTDMKLFFTDGDFLNLYGVDIVAGRTFSEEMAEDRIGETTIINEAAVRALGWSDPAQAIGREFGGGWGKVVGVMKDFHYRSLQIPVEPLAMFMDTNRLAYVSVRIRSSDWPGTVSAVQQVWKRSMPDYPFEYFFLDENFDRQYDAEQRLSRLLTGFAALAIFVACLGLTGLVAFLTRSRTREIGIRKVAGASTTQIILLLNSSITRLILLAAAIASPLTWLLLRRWLDGFPFRTTIHPAWFLLAVFLLLALAWLSSAWLSWRAARANPVEALRCE